MNVQSVFGLITISRKLLNKVLFNDFVNERMRMSIFKKVRLNAFYVIMKRSSSCKFEMTYLLNI